MNTPKTSSVFASIRILVVAAIIRAVALVMWYMNSALLKPPEVEMPSWTFRQLPLQFGDWQGEDTQLDRNIALATGASIIVDRLYQDVSNHGVKMHTAFFEDPSKGVYHNPMNCYRANGWTLKSETRKKIPIADNKTLEVSFTTWELDKERVNVVYWYQLGEHLLYGRSDLGLKVRWALRGQPKWPVLIKVMLQIPAPADAEEPEKLILAFTKRLASWINEHEERDEAADGMNRTIRNDTSGPQKTDKDT